PVCAPSPVVPTVSGESWRKSSDPLHPFSCVVKEWVTSEVSPEGIRPRPRFRAWFLPLSQKREDGGRRLPKRARREQSKAPNRVLIRFWNVLGPTINEIFQRVGYVNLASRSFIFSPKRDRSLLDRDNAALRNRWPPYITTGISQEMLFRIEGLNLNAPPTRRLRAEQDLDFVIADVGIKLSGFQGRAKKFDHRFSPTFHQPFTVVVDTRAPVAG